MSDDSKFSLKEFFNFIISKTFLKHFSLIILFYIIIILGLLFWLNSYTHHGQALTLPDFTGKHVEKAMVDAEKNHFKLIVDDSIHIVGKPGGIILSQNPKQGAKVKENRKIYVIVTKYNPDKIKVEDLPALYGRNFNSKEKELKILKINSKIIGYEYDKGEPNYILKVFYKNKPIVTKEGKQSNIEIEKGDTLEFILSKKSGGMTDLPNLRCMTAEQAVFLIESRKLKLGLMRKNGTIVNNPEGYV
ncbi:MAG TPA: PASTA domain-containing protein, partial [Bacteroidetes bacterium]|nr:PASTA domain-containing protein [Bacteroidota bacterium]